MRLIVIALIVLCKVVVGQNSESQMDKYQFENNVIIDSIECKCYSLKKNEFKTIKCFFDTNTLAMEYKTINEMLNGYLIEYHKEGGISLLYNFTKDVRNGVCIEYYKNGNMKTSFNYLYTNNIDTIKPTTSYDTVIVGGEIKCCAVEVLRPKYGIKESFYHNGKLSKLEKYKNEILDGICYYYNTNGVLINTRKYAKGKLVN
jgi:antitoxin component YwqK of YwqJK toxin-antitoxin module